MTSENKSYCTILFNDSSAQKDFVTGIKKLSKLGQVTDIRKKYLTCENEPNQSIDNFDTKQQLKNANVSWFKPNVDELDLIAHAFYQNFLPKYFTTKPNNDSKDHHQFDGDELKPINGQFHGCVWFENQTGEIIQNIVFMSSKNHHSKISIDRNGLVTYKHVNSKLMRHLWSNAIYKVLHQRTKQS